MNCLLFHRWSPWGSVIPAEGMRGETILVQFRHCRKCRKADMRRAA